MSDGPLPVSRRELIAIAVGGGVAARLRLSMQPSETATGPIAGGDTGNNIVQPTDQLLWNEGGYNNGGYNL